MRTILPQYTVHCYCRRFQIKSIIIVLSLEEIWFFYHNHFKVTQKTSCDVLECKLV